MKSLPLLALLPLLACATPKSSVPPRELAAARTATPLKDRVLLHREGIRKDRRWAPKVVPTELYGEGVNPDVKARSRKRGRRTDMTHYNPSTPETVLIHGKETRVLAVRAEERGSEHSRIRFFEVENDGERLRRIVDESVPALRSKNPLLNLQDPSLSVMDGDLYIGGVEITQKSPADPRLSYRHVIYKAPGRELSQLSETPVFVGEWEKKGTRFAKLKDGRMLVVSRPQRENFGGRGKIAWSVVEPVAGETFQQTMDRGVEQGRLLEGHVNDLEWEGPNKLYVLPDGRVLFLSHQAAYSGGARRKGGEASRSRSYVSSYFVLDPGTGQSTSPEVILERKDLPGGVARGAKRRDLSNVVYTSGVETNPDGSIKVDAAGSLTLWFGEGDLLVGRAKIRNFLAETGPAAP